MSDGPEEIPVYEIPADALRRPWVSRSFLRFIEAQRLVPRQPIGAAVGAAILSVIAHALLVSAVIWGGVHPENTREPDEQGPGSSAVVSQQEPVMTLILINDQSISRKIDTTDYNLASRGFAPSDLLVTLLSPIATPAFDFSIENKDDEATAAPEPAMDGEIRALLFGRYVGQIRARIERAWLRPREPIGAGSFFCRVQITQDYRGNVKETTLQRCNGNAMWQLSLARAIQRASPLPAPPDPRVFADAVVLEFDSTAYVAGGSTDGFEPASLGVAANSAMTPALSMFGRQLAEGRRGDKDAPSAIDLRIVGSSSAGGSSAMAPYAVPPQGPPRQGPPGSELLGH